MSSDLHTQQPSSSEHLQWLYFPVWESTRATELLLQDEGKEQKPMLLGAVAPNPFKGADVPRLRCLKHQHHQPTTVFSSIASTMARGHFPYWGTAWEKQEQGSILYNGNVLTFMAEAPSPTCHWNSYTLNNLISRRHHCQKNKKKTTVMLKFDPVSDSLEFLRTETTKVDFYKVTPLS